MLVQPTYIDPEGACKLFSGNKHVELAAEPKATYVATTEADGVIRVKGPAKHEDDLAGHHCTAAKIATQDGAATIEWVGGVARPAEIGFEADMAYEFGADPSAARWDEPEKGGAVLTANWLPYCDQAGIPREDKA